MPYKSISKVAGFLLAAFLFGILASLLGGKAASQRFAARPLYKDDRRVVIEPLAKIGGDDLDKPEYFFGYISDFFIDLSDNIYILDVKNGYARKFSPEGRYLGIIGKGLGQGPGEFMQASQIGVDQGGEVYIGDRSTRKISVFDSQGIFVNSFPLTKIAPASSIALDLSGRLFVGVDPLYISAGIWRKGAYQVYSGHGLLIGGFGESIDSRDAEINIGANSIHVNAIGGDVIISYAMPYRIEIYTNELRMKLKFGRLCEEYARTIKIDGVRYSCGSSYRVTSLSDGKIVNLIRCVDDTKVAGNINVINFLDVFDDKGNFLMSIPGRRFNQNCNDIRGMRADRQGHLYLVYEDPYPYIEKYRISFLNAN